MKKSILALSALLSIIFFESCSVSPKGGATPKDLIVAAKDANGDTKALKSCYYWSTPEEEANVDAILSLKDLKPEADAFMEEGKKKFGEDFSKAYGMGTFLLAMTTTPTPYDKMVDGQYVEADTIATVTTAIVENNTTSTAKADMVKKEGKWYFPAPTARGPKTPVQIAELMKQFLAESKKALETSDSPEKFAEAINTFMSTKMN